MPSTLNLQATLNWCAPILGFIPLTCGGLEPALSNANMIKQTILGPPFSWRFNRASAAVVCTANLQDKAAAISDFGFIEKAWLDTAVAGDIKELEVKNGLGATTESSRPRFISAQLDDNAGNITFRWMPRPEQAYSNGILYQKRPTLMTSLASTWTPIPDEYSYIFNFGFLALSALTAQDERFPIYNTKFLAHLLAAQDGIDETQRNLFLGNWLEITKQAARSTIAAQMGTNARGK
jgi:hypothetical protein